MLNQDALVFTARHPTIRWSVLAIVRLRAGLVRADCCSPILSHCCALQTEGTSLQCAMPLRLERLRCPLRRPSRPATRNRDWDTLSRVQCNPPVEVAEARALVFETMGAATGASREGLRDFLDSLDGRYFVDALVDELARGATLKADTAVLRWMGWRIGRWTSRKAGISPGPPLSHSPRHPLLYSGLLYSGLMGQLRCVSPRPGVSLVLRSSRFSPGSAIRAAT